MDKYFRTKLEELGARIEEFSREVQSVDPDKKNTVVVTGVDKLWHIRTEVNEAAEAVSHEDAVHESTEGIDSIVNGVLEDYHIHEVTKVNRNFNSDDYNALCAMVNHYKDMSIQIRYNEFIFDGKHSSVWQRSGIKEENSIDLYAHDLKGNAERAKRAVENITRFLGEVKTQDKYIHYIVREITVGAEYGLHARPLVEIVAAAEEYEGDIYLRFNGKTADAKSIMQLMTLCATKGSKVEILFEPGIPTTSTYNKINEIANNNQHN